MKRSHGIAALLVGLLLGIAPCTARALTKVAKLWAQPPTAEAMAKPASPT